MQALFFSTLAVLAIAAVVWEYRQTNKAKS